MSSLIEWNGEIVSFRNVCKKEGISISAVYHRMERKGEDPKTAILYYLTQPNRGNKEKFEIDGIVANLLAHCNRLGVSYGAVKSRVYKTGESAKESFLYYLNQPNKGYKEKIELNGELLDAKACCKKVGVNYNAVRHYKEVHPEMEYIDIINILKNNIGGGSRERVKLSGEYIDVIDYCKKLNYDYNLVTKYKKSQPNKSYTEILKEWETLSQDEILNNIHLHGVWWAMMDRCYNPNNPAYKYYGEKGIKVFEKWHDYLEFKEDNWEEYTKHIEQYGKKQTTIDRVDWNKDYCPSNCEWADIEQQARNKSSTKYILPCNNYQKTLAWHCKQNGYKYGTIRDYIIKYNLTPDEALAKYLEKRKKK